MHFVKHAQFAEFFNSYGKDGNILSPHLVKEMLLPGTYVSTGND